MIVRESGLSGWGRFTVRVDERRVGKLAPAASQSVDVQPGTHLVRVSQSGYSSKARVVSVADGETVILLAGMSSLGSYLNSLSGFIVFWFGYRLFAQGLTSTGLALFGLGVAGLVTVLAARLVIRLRPAPAE